MPKNLEPDHLSVESWLVSAGRDARPGSPLNVPPTPASNFILGHARQDDQPTDPQRAYSRDDGTPGWDALEQIIGGLEGGSSVAFASGMGAIAAVFDQLPDVRGDVPAADAVCAAARLIQHATSLGAVESTMERRAGIPGQEHLPPTLLRLSVGIEDAEDLWADLDRALRNPRAGRAVVRSALER